MAATSASNSVIAWRVCRLPAQAVLATGYQLIAAGPSTAADGRGSAARDDRRRRSVMN
jgi:hypothetical protein